MEISLIDYKKEKIEDKEFLEDVTDENYSYSRKEFLEYSPLNKHLKM